MTQRTSLGGGIRRVTNDSGETRYEARINRAGEKSIQKRFAKRSEATQWRVEQLKNLAIGAPITDGKKFLIKDIIDEYLEHRDTSMRPVSANHRTDFVKVQEDLGESTLTQLKNDEIDKWITYLQRTPKGKYKNGKDMAPYAEASVRRFYFSLKQSVEWHQRKHGYHLRVGLFKLDMSRVPRAWEGHRERRLKKGEEQALYGAGLTRRGSYTREDWQAVIGFALETGMRTQEITLATFDDLENDGLDLNIPKDNTKTSTKRKVFLSPTARAIIATQKATCPAGSSRIFHQFPSAKALSEAFIDLRKRAKINDLHFHDLRHEATSRMCEQDIFTLHEIMQITGHTSIKTFSGYVLLFNRKHKLRNQDPALSLGNDSQNKSDT